MKNNLNKRYCSFILSMLLIFTPMFSSIEVNAKTLNNKKVNNAEVKDLRENESPKSKEKATIEQGENKQKKNKKKKIEVIYGNFGGCYIAKQILVMKNDNVSDIELKKVLKSIDGKIAEKSYLSGIYIVEVPDNDVESLWLKCDYLLKKYPKIIKVAGLNGVNSVQPVYEIDRDENKVAIISYYSLTNGSIENNVVDVDYFARASKGETIAKVSYIINDKDEKIVYDVEKEQEQDHKKYRYKNSLNGIAKVYLTLGENKIVLKAVDTSGKVGLYEKKQRVKYVLPKPNPSIEADELSYLSDGSGGTFVNDRITLYLRTETDQFNINEVIRYMKGYIIGRDNSLNMINVELAKNTEKGLENICKSIEEKYSSIIKEAKVERFDSEHPYSKLILENEKRGEKPSIVVSTAFSRRDEKANAIDVNYTAIPSKDSKITEVSYSINEGWEEYIYISGKRGKNTKGTLGTGKVLLVPGENKIVFKVVDSSGKSAEYTTIIKGKSK